MRGTALIAVVKDILVYVTVLAAVIVIPAELGGYAKIFAVVAPKHVLLAPGDAQGNLGADFAYVTLALGSLLALFLYPHSVTGLLSSSSRHVDPQRNAMVLPTYSVALALHCAAGLHGDGGGCEGDAANMRRASKASATISRCPPCSCRCSRPGLRGSPSPPSPSARWCRLRSWRSPAATFSPATSIKEFIKPDCTPQAEAKMAKLIAFVAKLGALFFVLELQTTYAIQLQLLGGIWICQTVPAVLLALYVRLDPRALLAGLAVGVGLGTWMVVELGFKSSILSAAHTGRHRALLCRDQRAGGEPGGELAADAGVHATGGLHARDETAADDYA